jgi:hypothetical protein
LFGGLIGLVVDFSSGGAKKLSPDNVNVVLVKKAVDVSITDEKKATPKEEATDQIKNIEKELEELDRMKAEGKISEDEYKVMRQKAIERY